MIMINIIKVSVRMARISSAKLLAAFSPRDVKRPENMGTKAAFMAPSANILRKSEGSLIAMMKASEAAPAPSNDAMSISRKNPVKRLPIVKLPTVAIERNNFIKTF